MIDHPNCVKFFGSFVQDPHVVIVLEYVKDGSLLELLRRVGTTLPVSQLNFM